MEEDIDDLLAQLSKEIQSSKQKMSKLKSNTQNAKKQLNIQKKEEKKIITKDMVLQQQPKYTFGKTQRFKVPANEEPEQNNDLGISQLSILSVSSAHEMVKKKQPNVVIPKAKRFNEKNQMDERDYNCNLDAVKKNGTGVKIAPPPKQKKTKQQLIDQLRQEHSVTNSTFMDDLETQASMCDPGPGFYQPKYEAVDVQRTTTMSKASRFPAQKIDEKEAINPNYKVLQKNAPSTVIKNQLQKTKQYQIKQQQLESLADAQAKAELQRPLQLDAGIRKNIGTAILKSIDAAPNGSKEKKFMLFYLLDKIREMRNNGPGTQEEHVEKPAPCMVRFRSHSTERRVPDNHQDPGPNYYYCKDDMWDMTDERNQKRGFTFAKEGEEVRERWEDIDRREALDVNDDFIRKRVVGGLINKEHDEKPFNEQEIIDMYMGPGKYDKNFKLTEQRTDIGITKFQEITDKNDRENNMDYLKKETYDNEDLNPNLEAIKPQIKGNVKLHEPTEHYPVNPPESELVKEQWQFYDVNLDTVKEKAITAQLAPGGKDRDAFLEHENFMNMMKEYFDRQKHMPEGYDVSYKQIDKKVKVPDLKKNLIKDLLDPIEKPEGDVDGDNLLLNPQLPPKKLPNINIKKTTGRKLDDIEELKQENENKDELILNPKKEKKIKGFVNFKKQTKRPTYEDEIEDKRENDSKPPLNPNTEYLEPKIKGDINFKKQSKRPEGPQQKDEEIIMDVKTDAVKPSIKGGRW